MGSHSKYFFNTDSASIVFTHYPLECFGSGKNSKNCRIQYLDESEAQVNHYRTQCTYDVGQDDCKRYQENFLQDERIIDLCKSQVMENVLEIKKEVWLN